VKRLPVLFASCAAMIQCAVMPTTFGQESTSTIPPDLQPALVRAHSGRSQVGADVTASNAHKVSFGGNWASLRTENVESKDPTGGFRVDYAFTGTSGGLPTAALIQDAAGNLYGTTSSGGSGFGVVFKLDTANQEIVLHVFTGPDGATPLIPLLYRHARLFFGGFSELAKYGPGWQRQLYRYGNTVQWFQRHSQPDCYWLSYGRNMHTQPHFFEPSTCGQLDVDSADQQLNTDRFLCLNHQGDERECNPKHRSHTDRIELHHSAVTCFANR
jgi:uncharacterized repeat protein (TIGR03803 family)